MSQVALDQDVVSNTEQHQRKPLAMTNWFLSLRRQPKDKRSTNKKRIQRSCADLTEDNQNVDDIVGRSSNDPKRIMKSKFYVPYASESVIPAANKSVDNLLDDLSDTATSPLKNCMSCCPQLLSSNSRESSSKLTAAPAPEPATTTTITKTTIDISNGGEEVDKFAQKSMDLGRPTSATTKATGFLNDSMKDTIDNALRNYSLIQTSEIIRDEKITSSSTSSTFPNTCCIAQKTSKFHRISRTTVSTLESSRRVERHPVVMSPVNLDDNVITTSLRNLKAALSSPESGLEMMIGGDAVDPLSILEKDLRYIDDILVNRAVDSTRSNSESCLQHHNAVNRRPAGLYSNSNQEQSTTNNDDNNNILKLGVNGHGDHQCSINNILHRSNNNICVIQGSQHHEVGSILYIESSSSLLDGGDESVSHYYFFFYHIKCNS